MTRIDGPARAWSCDTLYAGSAVTRSGRAILAKNSDRPAREAQPLRRYPARAGGGTLSLAYLSIDDPGAYATVGSAPHWCWGYEFGINEHNLAIGNEALFTAPWAAAVARSRAGDEPAPGILGMELLRLGLERAATAREAVTVMTDLLEEHGQWGSAQASRSRADGSYDNAFVLADGTQAYVLETAGRDWAAREISSEAFTISNQPTIRKDFDLSSPTLDQLLREHDESFGSDGDFARAIIDLGTPLQVSRIRQQRSAGLLAAAAAEGVSEADFRAILRDHLDDGAPQSGPFFNPALPDFHTLCMHEHPAGFTWGNTAASVIYELAASPDELTVQWWTPLTPCVGAYIPLFPTAARSLPTALTVPEAVPPQPPETMPTSQHLDESYWWEAQNLLDTVKGDAYGRHYVERHQLLRTKLDPLEAGFVDAVEELRSAWATASAEDRATTLAQRAEELTSDAAARVHAACTEFVRMHG